MRIKTYIYLGACLLLCGITAVASWASSEEEVRENLQQLIATKQCPSCNLRGAALTRMDLQGANLQGADLSGAKLSLTNLSNADLRNAVLQNAVLGGADFAGADLRGVDFTGAQLAGAYLKEAIHDKELIQDKTSESEAQPQAEEDNEAGSEKLDPMSSGMEEKPVSPVIEEKQEEVASEDSSGSETPVSGDLEPQQERKKEEKKKPPVTLPDIEERAATNVRPKELVPLEEIQQIETVPESENSAVTQQEELSEDLPEPVQSEEEVAEVSEVAPAEQVGTYTVETFAQSRARLQAIVDKLHEKKRCVACDLAGADLRGQDLKEVDLERADLSGAQLEDADLHSANLKGVNFTDANLKNADLRKVDLYLADFTNANLTGAQLKGALIDSTEFTGAIGAKLEAAQK
ncbi:pentapeptide repeat-containing protein [Candidatus Electrothrix sp.]|uniref:pentapeptide repeat-containing protein n=2 Tax=Candidatus Electrothrix sp. TaxID=2170559 RepID=UPI0040562E56